MRNPLLLLSGILFSSSLWAHPGHGHSPQHGFSLLHYLSEPEHVAGLVLLVAVIAAVAARVVRRQRALPLKARRRD